MFGSTKPNVKLKVLKKKKKLEKLEKGINKLN